MREFDAQVRHLDQNERFRVENHVLEKQGTQLGAKLCSWARSTHNATACVGNCLCVGDAGRVVGSGEPALLSEPGALGNHLKTLPPRRHLGATNLELLGQRASE